MRACTSRTAEKQWRDSLATESPELSRSKGSNGHNFAWMVQLIDVVAHESTSVERCAKARRLDVANLRKLGGENYRIRRTNMVLNHVPTKVQVFGRLEARFHNAVKA